ILYTEKVHARTVHIADQNGELSVQAGAARGAAEFALRISEEENRESCQWRQQNRLSSYCVLCPGGGWRAKCWPAERFGELCARVGNELGLRCVVNYGPGEDDLAKTVRAASASAEPILVSSEVGTLMALLRGAKVVVGGDTGPLHLALALGTPVVALHGPTDPARNGPYGSGGMVLRSAGARRNHARRNATDPSMLEIGVDAVLEAVKQQLSARAGTRP
ncbi:MAG TPA: glycosyltransferase family 9 protein, partial [Methylomirabilota bacterium]|nr:glycosyltransferase family 9 protein [Methylomirabilota bacterium]